MVQAEDIRKTILKLADERGPERTFAVSDVARAVDENNWVMLMDQVRFVADVLVREGKINATPTGKMPIDSLQLRKRK
ncbi:MAG TPA: DUF3253 domain-containing protein [Ohtaekwangia sp.]